MGEKKLVFVPEPSFKLKKERLTKNSKLVLKDFIHYGDYSVSGEEQIIQIENKKTENRVFYSGDKILLKGKIRNPEYYSLSNVQLWGGIYKLEKDKKKSEQFGNCLLDDFLIWKSANLKKYGRYEFKHWFKIPKFLPSGEYVFSMALVKDNRFFLRGVPYIEEGISNWENPLGILRIKVENKKNFRQPIEIDKESISVKNKKGVVPFSYPGFFLVYQDDPFEIVFELLNNKNYFQEVELNFELIRIQGKIFKRFLEPKWENKIEKENFKIGPLSRKRVIFRTSIKLKRKNIRKGTDYLLLITINFKDGKFIVPIPLTLKEGLGIPKFIDLGINQSSNGKNGKYFWYATKPHFPKLIKGNKVERIKNRNKNKIKLKIYNSKNQLIEELVARAETKKGIDFGTKKIKELPNEHLKLIGKIIDSSGILADYYRKDYNFRKL